MTFKNGGDGMSVHDFWSGKTSIPPGLQPALPRHAAAAGQCIPQRNRLTGAYQAPAPVWKNVHKLSVQELIAIQNEREAAQVPADEIAQMREVISQQAHTIERLRAQLGQMAEQSVTVGSTDRFEWLEIRGSHV